MNIASAAVGNQSACIDRKNATAVQDSERARFPMLLNEMQLRAKSVLEIVTAYTNGATVYELATQHEIHRQTVSAILKRWSAPTRYRLLDDRQVEQAVDLYGRGWSLAKVGELLGVADNTVRAALMRAGVRLRDSHGREAGD